MIHVVFSMAKTIKHNFKSIVIILKLSNPSSMFRGFVLCIRLIRTTMMQSHINTKESYWRRNIPSELCMCEVECTYLSICAVTRKLCVFLISDV